MKQPAFFPFHKSVECMLKQLAAVLGLTFLFYLHSLTAATTSVFQLCSRDRSLSVIHDEQGNRHVLLPAGELLRFFRSKSCAPIRGSCKPFSPLWLTRPVARSGARIVDSSSILGTESHALFWFLFNQLAPMGPLFHALLPSAGRFGSFSFLGRR